MSRGPVTAICLAVLLQTATATAQGLCPDNPADEKPLACIIPQIFGTTGFVDATSPIPDTFVTKSLSPFSTSIARQSAQLPLASPASGFTYSWDPSAKIYVETTESLGPIFGERAETIGRFKTSIAFAYQSFKFDTLDGFDLGRVPVVITQPDQVIGGALGINGTKCSINGGIMPPNTPAPVTDPNSYNSGSCAFIRNFVTMETALSLTISQYTTFVTFGLTNRLDVSMAIPIESIRMSMSYDSAIVPNGTPPNTNPSALHQHYFPTRTDCPFPCQRQTGLVTGEASGIGDVTLRVKGNAWKGKQAGVAVGTDIRFPTGDELNYLGAGTMGIRPFVIGSYRARVSPHGTVGYEMNGSSFISGDVTTETKGRVPGQLAYTGGADVLITNWLTAAVDFVGQTIFETPKIDVQTLNLPDQCPTSSTCPATRLTTRDTIVATTQALSLSSASVGFKVRPVSSLLITVNALIKMNDASLRAKTVPLLGIWYTF